MLARLRLESYSLDFSMLETVATGLIVTAVTGITYLAYKHPHAYGRAHGAALFSAVLFHYSFFSFHF